MRRLLLAATLVCPTVAGADVKVDCDTHCEFQDDVSDASFESRIKISFLAGPPRVEPNALRLPGRILITDPYPDLPFHLGDLK